MKNKDSLVFLYDILDCVSKISRFTQGMELEDFVGNDLVVDAVVRNLEVIGEAAKNVSEEVKTRFPHIPWSKMVALRNVLIHEYFGVDKEIIWRIIRVDLPETRPLLENVVEALDIEPSPHA